MAWQLTSYTIPLISAAITMLILALQVWRRRAHQAGERTGVLLLLSGAEWMLAYAAELSSAGLEVKLFWSKMQYWGIAVIPTAWFVFALQSTGREKWLTRRNLVLLSIVPLITLLTVFTNDAHGLIWSHYGLNGDTSFPRLEKTYGVGFSVFFVYSYGLASLGFLLLFGTYVRSQRLYRRQIQALLLAVSAVGLGGVLGRLGWSPVPGLHLEPFAIGVSGLIVAWGLFRLRLGDVMPVAHELIIQGMSDCVLVLDPQHRVLELNPSAQRLLGRPAEQIIGQPINEVWAAWPKQMRFRHEKASLHREITVGERETQRTVDVRISPLLDAQGQLISQVIVLRDITQHKRMETALRQAEAETRRQLEEQKALREAVTVVASTLEPEEVLNHVSEQMCQAVDATSVYILSWDGRTKSSTSLAEYYSPHACARERVSDLGNTYEETDPRFLKALLAGRPWIDHLDDPELNAETREIMEAYGVRSVLGIPLRLGKQVTGYAELYESRRRREFTADEVNLCRAIAQNAAVALEHARMYERMQQQLSERVRAEEALRALNKELEDRVTARTAELTHKNKELTRRNRELLSLQAAAAATASSLDLPFVLETVTWEMVNLLRADGCTIFHWDPNNDTLSVLAEYGGAQWPDDEAPGRMWELAGCPIRKRVLTERFAQQFTASQTDIDETELAYLQRCNIKSLLMLPMAFQARTVGLVQITDGQTERTFNDQQISLAQLLANQAASAIQNAQLYAETQRRLREQTALREAGTAISSALDLQTVLTHIVEQMARAVDATSAYMSSYDAKTMMASVIAEYISPQACDQEKISDLGEAYVEDGEEGWLDLMRAGRHDISHIDSPDLTETERAHMLQFGAKSILYVPLRTKGQLIGYIELWDSRRQREFTSEEISLCHGIAQQAAIAIENAQLYQRAQREIAERKRAEEQIKVSLKEKEALLQEIHHRVKNNLQVVSSLLNLQSRYTQDESALEMFQESQNRILSMALIHEKLYRSRDLARVDLAEYIRSLANDLIHSYRAQAGPVNLKVNAADVFLGIDKAVPCGLIVNELVSNALKHAFPSRRKNGKEGEVRIDLSLDSEDKVTLTVSDNGVGFPEDLDFQTLDSLGLRLVNTLIDQLDGTLELNCSGGTEFKLRFAPSYGERTP